MVKSQLWQSRQTKPFRFGCIILACNSNRFIDDGQISDSDSPSSWVSINLRVCSNLMHLRNSKSRFFFQFTDSTLLRGFIHIHETTWESPASLERFIATFNQQNFRIRFFRYNDAVSSNCRSWIFVCVCHNN